MTDIPTPQDAPAMAEIVITVDHVYLPLDAKRNVAAGWAAGNVSTSKVLRGARLKVPDDLALFLVERKQAEIV